MNSIDWSKVVYMYKNLVIPYDQVKDYYYKGVELEIYYNDQFVGYTDIKEY